LGSSLPKIGGQKLITFVFVFDKLEKLNGEYLLNETRRRQPGKGVGNYKESPISSQDFMNFGPQMAKNWIGVFTHLP